MTDLPFYTPVSVSSSEESESEEEEIHTPAPSGWNITDTSAITPKKEKKSPIKASTQATPVAVETAKPDENPTPAVVKKDPVVTKKRTETVNDVILKPAFEREPELVEVNGPKTKDSNPPNRKKGREKKTMESASIEKENIPEDEKKKKRKKRKKNMQSEEPVDWENYNSAVTAIADSGANVEEVSVEEPSTKQRLVAKQQKTKKKKAQEPKKRSQKSVEKELLLSYEQHETLVDPSLMKGMVIIAVVALILIVYVMFFA